jgi:hypothetical protein
MINRGEVLNLIIQFNPHYGVRSCKWTKMPGFAEADVEAFAFIACCALKFHKQVVGLVANQLSPLAVGILWWAATEVRRAAVNHPELGVTSHIKVRRFAVDFLEAAQFAGRSNRLGDG